MPLLLFLRSRELFPSLLTECDLLFFAGVDVEPSILFMLSLYLYHGATFLSPKFQYVKRDVPSFFLGLGTVGT